MASPRRSAPPVVDEALLRDLALPDVDWAAIPPGTVRETFRAPSGPLAVWSTGPPDGPRVVLVPGATGSKEDFRFQLPELARAGHRVESFDLAGQYESWGAGPEHCSPPRRAYDYRLFVEDLTAFLALGRTPAHVVGYSFAGVVAQQVAAARPDLMASLTLLSTPPLTGQVFRGVRHLGLLGRITPPRAIAAAMRWSILANVQHVPPGRQRFVEHRFTLTRPTSLPQVIGLMRRVPDLRAPLRAAPFPIAIAVGTRDLWPLAAHRRFAADLGATIAIYRSGHSPCETAPYQFSRDLIALFAKAAHS